MNKIEQIRDEKAEELVEALSKGEKDFDEERIFMEGFNVCLALELPIKFAEWCRYGKYEAYKNIVRECTVKGMDNEEVTKELYQYWITHIYKGE